MKKIEIDYPRNEFIKELDNYIDEGKELYKKFQYLSMSPEQLKLLERELKFWDEEVQEFIKIRLHTFILDNVFLNDFKNISQADWNAAIKSLGGQQVDTVQSKYNHLLSCIQKKADVLVLLKRKSKFMDVVEYYRDTLIENQEVKMKEIFISHSTKDKIIADNFIDLILHGALSVPIDKIFCTSTDGTKIKSGTEWRNSILSALKEAKLNFLLISPNYKESEVCMNEMGAAWIASANVIPLIIEPINYNSVGVIQEPVQIEKLLDEKSLDRIKDLVQETLDIPNELIKSDRWTTKKKEFVLKTKNYLKSNSFVTPLDRQKFDELIEENDDLEKTLSKIIEEKSELEDLVEELKNAKDKEEVKTIVKKHSDTSQFDEFEEIGQNLHNALNEFQPIIIGIIFKTYSSKDITIRSQVYSDDIDEALANDYINDELDANFTTTSKMNRILDLLDELSAFLKQDLTEEFIKQYAEEYEAPMLVSSKLFWEEVLELRLYFN